MRSSLLFYTVLIAGFLLFLISRPSHRPHHHASRRFVLRRAAGFDRTIGRSEWADGYRNFDSSGKSDAFSGKTEEGFEDGGGVNVSERLVGLFPLLDKSPVDGWVSFRELEDWNVGQGMERLKSRTEREMRVKDVNGDGLVTFKEFLPHFSHEDIVTNSMYPGHAGWWKEQFINADGNGDGLLNGTEFNDFLHPGDSDNSKILQWLRTEKIRYMDEDEDGKISLTEFRDKMYHVFKSNLEFGYELNDKQQKHESTPEEKFGELDVNKDRFLTEEELEPIRHQLHPGELAYAKYYTNYLMREVDYNRDGGLTLEEMLDHSYAFYEDDDDDDDDDYDDDFHDELR